MKSQHLLIQKICTFILCITCVYIGFGANTTQMVYADELSLVGSTSIQGTVGVAMPVTDVQVAGGTGATTVPVKLRVTSGTLQMSVTTGLTFTGGQTGSTLYFSGTRDAVNTALATLTYTRGGVGTDTLEVSLVASGEVFFPDNGHLYEYVSYTSNWVDAKAQAELRTKYGASGYLVTIGSLAENNFVKDRLLNAGWMGGSDSAVEGAWRWVTGPEAGTQFWSGLSSQNGGATVGGQYANWGTGEPNNSGEEDCAQFLSGSSGLWNDLPCSSYQLPGYVVEYGAAGNLPTVAAKNVAITTSASPVLVSVSPLDNATGISTTSPLVLTFSQAVTAGAGAVTIKKVSDDSIVESILTASTTRVSGTGTTVITINPTAHFEEQTAYYVLLGTDAFKNVSDAYVAGISSPTVWNFTIGDFTAPVISSILATSTSSTTIAISWNTNELASSMVLYTPHTTDVFESTAETDTAPRVTERNVIITDLIPCTIYRYKVRSADGSSNVATSTDNLFVRTLGCIGSPSTVETSALSIDPSAGGSHDVESDLLFRVVAPAFFADASSTVSVQITPLDSDDVLLEINHPDASYLAVGSDVFDVKALFSSGLLVESFDIPVTVSFEYSDEDIVGINESTLRMYHYHAGIWSALEGCTVDTSANKITCTTDSFSVFALFGLPLQAQQAPTGSGVGMRASFEYGCRDTRALNYSQFVAHRPELCTYSNAQSVQSAQLIAQGTAQHISTNTNTQEGKLMYPRALHMGVTGDDVQLLQEFLNTHGFEIASSGPGSKGKETRFYGLRTKQAVIRFQKAKGIIPAVGYFGPLTRSVVLESR